MSKLSVLSRAEDQRKEILANVVPYLDSISAIYGNDVLTATYIEPEVTKGGIYLPDQRKTESVYQGKVGLVLALGIDAFKYSGGYDFICRQENEDDEAYKERVSQLIPKQGDWVFYRPIGNAWKCTINGVACQFVKDSEIKGRLDTPDIIF